MPEVRKNIDGVGIVAIHKKRGLKNMSLRVSSDGSIRLNLPWYVPRSAGMAFVQSKKDWLKKQIDNRPKPITEAERKYLDAKARAYLPGRLNELARPLGIRYKKIRFSNASTRWGSYSSKGTISLNIQLMRLPKELIDYVLVHELCHVRQLNHGPKFWSLVAEMDPDYKAHRKALRQNHPSA